MSDSIKVTVLELRLTNFRAFENARLTLSDLTFLVGRNGAGKSSLLDAIAFLQEAVTDSLDNALDRRGGLKNVRRLSAKPVSGRPRTMGLALAMSISVSGREPIQAVYGFELSGIENWLLSTGGLFNVAERLVFSGGLPGFLRSGNDFAAQGFNLPVSPPERNLVLPLIGRSDSLWGLVLDAIRGLRAYELSPAHMADAVEIGDRTTLARNGVNAGDVLKALSDEDQAWIDLRLAAITDGISGVRAEALLGRRVLSFSQKTESGGQQFDGSSVSQGTLRGLGVLLALRQHPTPSVVLIDEVENSVHPGALAVLIDAALERCEQTRVVLTSHSPELLGHSAVTGERVRVIQWRDGVSQVYRLSPETQAAINEIDTVGWMLSSNALWTRPDAETWSGDFLALADERP